MAHVSFDTEIVGVCCAYCEGGYQKLFSWLNIVGEV